MSVNLRSEIRVIIEIKVIFKQNFVIKREKFIVVCPIYVFAV